MVQISCYVVDSLRKTPTWQQEESELPLNIDPSLYQQPAFISESN